MKKKTRILVIIIAALVVIAGIISALIIRKRIKDRTVNIAFYGLSEDYVSLIKEQIPETEEVILKYDVLAPGALDLGNLTKKYDMLFTWKGEVTDVLEGGVEDIPGKILENIPISMRNKFCFPLLLDHYELDLYQPVMAKAGIENLADYSEFEAYFNEAKKYVFSPFFCKASDDRTLLALIGNFIEAKGGVAAYKKLIEKMRTSSSLDDFIDVELATVNSEVLSVRSVLDMLKSWPGEGITHPQWYRANAADVRAFAEDKQLAVLFMSLSEHREMPYKIISEYTTIHMPRVSENVDHGVISPAICGVLISNNSNCKNYLKLLASADVQSYMSMKTMMGPVHYRAESYDIQADDVRFWAASCAGGPLPDLSLAVYQRKPELQAAVVNEIRNYLK